MMCNRNRSQSSNFTVFGKDSAVMMLRSARSDLKRSTKDPTTPREAIVSMVRLMRDPLTPSSRTTRGGLVKNQSLTQSRILVREVRFLFSDSLLPAKKIVKIVMPDTNFLPRFAVNR